MSGFEKCPTCGEGWSSMMSVPVEPGQTVPELTCPNGHKFWRIDGELRPAEA